MLFLCDGRRLAVCMAAVCAPAPPHAVSVGHRLYGSDALKVGEEAVSKRITHTHTHHHIFSSTFSRCNSTSPLSWCIIALLCGATTTTTTRRSFDYFAIHHTVLVPHTHATYSSTTTHQSRDGNMWVLRVTL
uniref:Putative secreted protein n=1 Tax=Anopheles darlingi TaxID=43151 RepID=A0A2M4DLB6_ANODA